MMVGLSVYPCHTQQLASLCQLVSTTFNVVGSDFAMARAAEHLANLPFVLMRGDDVMVVGRTEEQHRDHYYQIEYMLEYDGVDVVGSTLNMAVPYHVADALVDNARSSEVGLSDVDTEVQDTSEWQQRGWVVGCGDGSARRLPSS